MAEEMALSSTRNTLSECFNCQEPFVDPRILPCLHTFCVSCVKDMAQQNRFSCSVCQEVVDVVDIKQLPRNFAAEACSYTVNNMETPSEAVNCADCADGTPATHNCEVCPTLLCEGHTLIHQRKKRHDMLPISRSLIGAGSLADETHAAKSTRSSSHALSSAPHTTPVYPQHVLCDKHPKEIVFAFCEDCSELVCHMCVTSVHKRHNFLEVPEAADLQAHTLKNASKKLSSQISDLSGAIDELQRLESALVARKATFMQEVQEKFSGYISQLENRRDVLLRDACLQFDADVKTLQLQCEALKVQHNLTQAAFIQADAMAEKAANHAHELLNLSRFVNARLRVLDTRELVLKPLVNDKLSLVVPATHPWCEPLDRFGALLRSTERRDFTLVEPKPIVVISSCGNQPVSRLRPAGIAVTKSGVLVVSDVGNHRLQLLTPQGAHVRTIGELGSQPGQLHWPQGVTVDDQGNIWVADSENNRLQCFSDQGKFLRHLDSQEPLDVKVLPNQDLVITTFHRVTVYSNAGNVRWSVGSDDAGNGPNQLNHPWGIAVTDNGAIVVSDRKNDRLLFMSSDNGELIRIIDDVNQPTAVCTAPGDFLLVTELDQVSVWTMNGVRVHSWGQQGGDPGNFESPEGICVLSDHSIAVGDLYRVQIF